MGGGPHAPGEDEPHPPCSELDLMQMPEPSSTITTNVSKVITNSTSINRKTPSNSVVQESIPSSQDQAYQKSTQPQTNHGPESHDQDPSSLDCPSTCTATDMPHDNPNSDHADKSGCDNEAIQPSSNPSIILNSTTTSSFSTLTTSSTSQQPNPNPYPGDQSSEQMYYRPPMNTQAEIRAIREMHTKRLEQRLAELDAEAPEKKMNVKAAEQNVADSDTQLNIIEQAQLIYLRNKVAALEHAES